MNQELLYRLWKTKRDREIEFDAANRALVAANRALDALVQEYATAKPVCPACAGKKNGKKCRAHTDNHPQWRK